MRYKQVWDSIYRDIPFEINNFKIGDRDCWAYYLYIRLDQMPARVRNKFWLKGKSLPLKAGRRHTIYDYNSEPLIAKIDWHYGCTWYEKMGGHSGEPRIVKIGCDYQHYWDECITYDQLTLEYRARESIDSLHKMIPGIMRVCRWCGRYFSPIDNNEKCPACIDRYSRGHKEDEPEMGDTETMPWPA